MSIHALIRRELRAVGLTSEPAQPLPTDLDAEAEVLSGVLTGDIAPADLGPLLPDHFYSFMHGAIWCAVAECAPGDLIGVRNWLSSHGWVGALDEELLQLTFAQPWRSLSRLREQADRIIELSKRRDLIRRLQRLEADLRTHRLTEPQAREQLRGVSE